MTDNTVRLTNGQQWTVRDFLNHYFRPTASGTTPVTGPPAPVDVDRSWYMSKGPGRYYHPGMFPVMRQIIDDRSRAPGTYDLQDFVPNRNAEDPALKAELSNYSTDVRSDDYPLRALVFGNESARILGRVVVNPDGSKTFKQIEIRPWDTEFDFKHKTWGPIEVPREAARIKYDPDNSGTSYQIQYRGPGPGYGTGRLYDDFSDAQLDAALRRNLVNPSLAPPGMPTSVTAQPPVPFVEAQRQIPGGAGNFQASAPAASSPTASGPVSPGSSGGDAAAWIASLAGVSPQNPTQTAPPPLDRDLQSFYRDDPAWLLQLRR
jgi:hypothetical protein